MTNRHNNSNRIWTRTLLILLAITLLAPLAAYAGDKKKKGQPKKPRVIDYSNIVWPNPPAIARIKYQAFYASDMSKRDLQGNKQKKQGWMDRLAGTQPESETFGLPFSLVQPYGVAVDSKGQLYIADQRVGAIFIFNTETRTLDLIKNKIHAHFARIIGLAMDDNDRLFVSDPGLRHVLVFDANHKAEDVITEGMVGPGALAIDRQNRLLYVADVELDQILVYDADSLKLLRKMGTANTAGHHHEFTAPGDFSKPAGVAVDKDGNLYVADTWNNRVEIFDADGTFISTFGKPGDGPGYFSRPKGIAIDCDGHIWVADGMQDRVQVFRRDGQLLISFGGHGLLPGEFQGLVGIAIDQFNRVFTTEIYPGRAQQFLYITDAQAEQLRKEREESRKKTSEEKNPTAPAEQPTQPAPAQTAPPG